MEAFCGFFGSPNKQLLTRMADALAHRKGDEASQLQQNEVSFYYSTHSRSWQQKEHAGFASIGKAHLAIAGFFTNCQKTPLHVLKDYLQVGESALTSLQGAFILALWDGEQGYLMRDGSGQRTLYYAEFDGRLLFANEPKGIHRYSGFKRQLNPGALAQYLSFSFVPQEQTMLQGLYELKPGHLLHYRQQQILLKRYFVFEETPIQEQDTVQRFQSHFSQAVASRLTDDKIGVFLSGGLDSSVITAELASQVNPEKIYSYSIHFGKKYLNELDFAQAVAKQCKTHHQEIFINPKHFLQRFREIIYYLDDPIGDPITIPNFELARQVKNEVAYVFNGEGGDPCFGGPKNYGMLLQHWYGVDRDEFFREKAYLNSFRRAYDELNHLLSPEIQQQICQQRDLVDLLTPYFNASKPDNFLNKLMAMNIRLKGAHLILPKVERMLGVHGLPSLSPLFDEEIVKYSFSIPPQLKLAQGDEKLIMKQAFTGKIPQAVIDRPKSGMRVPVHFWFQGELKRYAKHILSPKEIKKSGIFNPERVKQLLKYDTEEAHKRYGLKLWMLLSFEIWRRLVIDGEAL